MTSSAQGYFDPKGIKYFDIADLNVDVTCPHCQETYVIPLGERWLEYPEKHNEIQIDCWNEDCGEPITLIVDLEINVNATCEVKAVNMSNSNIIKTEDGKRYIIDLDKHIQTLESILKDLLSEITLSEEDHFTEWVDRGTAYIRPKIKVDSIKQIVEFVGES